MSPARRTPAKKQPSRTNDASYSKNEVPRCLRTMATTRRANCWHLVSAIACNWARWVRREERETLPSERNAVSAELEQPTSRCLRVSRITFTGLKKVNVITECRTDMQTYSTRISRSTKVVTNFSLSYSEGHRNFLAPAIHSRTSLLLEVGGSRRLRNRAMSQVPPMRAREHPTSGEGGPHRYHRIAVPLVQSETRALVDKSSKCEAGVSRIGTRTRIPWLLAEGPVR